MVNNLVVISWFGGLHGTYGPCPGKLTFWTESHGSVYASADFPSQFRVIFSFQFQPFIFRGKIHSCSIPWHIHGTAIFTYIFHTNLPSKSTIHVGKYTILPRINIVMAGQRYPPPRNVPSPEIAGLMKGLGWPAIPFSSRLKEVFRKFFRPF